MANCAELQTQIDSLTVSLVDLLTPGYCRRKYPDDINDFKTCVSGLDNQIADTQTAINNLRNQLQLCNGFLGLWEWFTFAIDTQGFTHVVRQRLEITSFDNVRLWTGILSSFEDAGGILGPPPQDIFFGTIDVSTLLVQFESSINQTLYSFSGTFATIAAPSGIVLNKITGTITNQTDGTRLLWQARKL